MTSDYHLEEEDQKFAFSGKLVHIILWVITVFLISMLIWAHFAILDEVTRAPGKVIFFSKSTNHTKFRRWNC